MLLRLIGAALHLFWNSFTHQKAFLVRHFSVLLHPIGLGTGVVPTFELLGLLSSVGGGVAIVQAVWQMPARPAGLPSTAAALWCYWGLAALVTLAMLVQWLQAGCPPLIGGPAVYAALIGVNGA